MPHAYRAYEGESHGFRKRETIIDVVRVGAVVLRPDPRLRAAGRAAAASSGTVSRRWPRSSRPGWAEALAPVAAQIAAMGEFLRAEVAAGRTLPAGRPEHPARVHPAVRRRAGADRRPGPVPDAGPPGRAVVLGRAATCGPSRAACRTSTASCAPTSGSPTAEHGDLTAVVASTACCCSTGADRGARAPGSHRGKGWEAVTDQAIRALVARGTPLVAILWGRDAQTLAPLLGDVPRIESAHPSPDVGRPRLLRLAAVQPGQRRCWPRRARTGRLVADLSPGTLGRTCHGVTPCVRGRDGSGQAGGEAAGGDRPQRVRRDADQRLALVAHRLAVLVPVGVLAADAAEVLDQPSSASGAACRAPRPSRRPAPRRRRSRRTAPARDAVGVARAGCAAWPVRGSWRSRCRPLGDTPPVTGDSCGEPSRRRVTRIMLMPGTDEVQQFVEVNGGVGGDRPGHVTQSSRPLSCAYARGRPRRVAARPPGRSRVTIPTHVAASTSPPEERRPWPRVRPMPAHSSASDDEERAGNERETHADTEQRRHRSDHQRGDEHQALVVRVPC